MNFRQNQEGWLQLLLSVPICVIRGQTLLMKHELFTYVGHLAHDEGEFSSGSFWENVVFRP
jgi:hypothetical protein